MKKIAIIGAGSWGTALSIALSRSRAAHSISLWAHETEVVESMRARRVNDVFLPDFELPAGIASTGDLAGAVDGRRYHAWSDAFDARAEALFANCEVSASARAAFVSATKGLEPETLLRMSEVIRQVIPADRAPRIAVLSGPSFAREVARGDPTAIVIASEDAQLRFGNSGRIFWADVAALFEFGCCGRGIGRRS